MNIKMQEEKDMNYYEESLEVVKKLFIKQPKVIEANKEAIRGLLEGYKKFENEPAYKKSLSLGIEKFVLQKHQK